MLNHYDLSHRSYTSSKNEPTSSFFDFVLSSPAKINLFFKILFKRPDGYHEIASLYQAIRLFDYLHFKKADTFTLTSSDPALAVDQTNLITKAVFLFCKHAGVEPRLHIHLDKNIPMQAGLGGGSGNAATTLFGMNALFNTGISSDKLALWSAELGSDVPFFFSSGSSYCTGRGEILQDIDQLKLPNTVTIVKPDFGLSTQLVYSHCKIADLPHNDPILTLEHIKHGSLDFYNDLE
ncbi:MAG: 4-(cytidine 5'-diphospho)-2-C-methyl-D-erythritol kinase, partial [Chlamydiae bacterium]|nr:4-(cytidine 5'-diphospho)-2-C-methyl-D-erythritol kinase [Chlamydiota bacterium]